MRILPVTVAAVFVASWGCVGGVKGGSDSGVPVIGGNGGGNQGGGQGGDAGGQQGDDPSDAALDDAGPLDASSPVEEDTGPPPDVGPVVEDVRLDGEQPEVTPNPDGKTFGQPCRGMEECKTGICARMTNFTLCSRFCDDNPCPARPPGWACRTTQMHDGRAADICFFEG